MARAPSLADIEATHSRLKSYITRTPSVVVPLEAYGIQHLALKLECLQQTGTFKVRGALNNILAAKGGASRVTAVSAGNHAVAVAFAAQKLNADAKVVMQASANPLRIARARSYGAEVVIAKDGPTAFEMATTIANEEGRLLIHPFEGPCVTEATAGVAVEMHEDCDDIDVLAVPIGGGGLASGVSLATKLTQPKCEVFGVEPAGADAMTRSFASGRPETLPTVRTIADSLGPPMTTPFAYEMCRTYVDDVVTVSEEQIAAATYLMFFEFNLAVEPAGATALAGILGPLKDRVKGKCIGAIVSGSNIDPASYLEILEQGILALNRRVFD